MALMALVENIVRRDLSPIEEADYFIKLLAMDIAWERIGTLLGLTDAQLMWKTQLVEMREKCRPEVFHLIRVQQMTPTMAWRLSRLSWNGQMRFLSEINAHVLTGPEQMGLADAIWVDENQPT